MKRFNISKRITALAFSLIMVLGLMPMTAYADGTYTFPSNSQSGNNNSTLRYFLTDENAASITITQFNKQPAIYLDVDEGWYFEKWETYFNGFEDIPLFSDQAVQGSNPVSDEGYYTFYNRSQTQPFANVTFLYIKTGTGLYGDHKVTAVLKPIVTIDADAGITYVLTTNNPTTLSANQTAIKYKDDVTVTYAVDSKYVVTSVNAIGTKTISIDKANRKVVLTDTEKPTSVGIRARLKQLNVSFDANGGNGTMANQVFEHSVAKTLTANSFTKDGYTFAGWNTKADGSGTAYSDKQSVTFTPSNDGDTITLYAQWVSKQYTVSFDANGGAPIDPISVTFGEKYGNLPTSAITGLSGGDKNWYLVDENGNVTDTNIKNLTKVNVAGNHTLFMKRSVLSPNVSIALTVPGGISDGYKYYIPGASQRVLTATVKNINTDILDYTYQWYKDGTPIDGAVSNVLTLEGNVSDSGTYKVDVTATLKDGTNIVVTSNSAIGSKEQKVTIMRMSNTLSYEANGGEGGPQSSYTGGTTLAVSKDMPNREHHDFIGWNTLPDGTGDEYKAEDVYTFANDGGNGGCVVTLYAQWKLKEYTVTYKADGEISWTEMVEYGGDATLPTVPAKDGYVGKWDSDGKNISDDTTISAVYTALPIVKLDEVKPEDKTDLEDTKTKLEELLKDDSYAEEEKGKIQDVIDDIDEALKVIGNVEAVEDKINKLPENITKNDEAAINAADEAYNALTDYEKSLVDADAKKALDDAKAALAELDKPLDTDKPSDSPATGDDSNLGLWLSLLLLSSACVLGITLNERKRNVASKR